MKKEKDRDISTGDNEIQGINRKCSRKYMFLKQMENLAEIINSK